MFLPRQFTLGEFEVNFLLFCGLFLSAENNSRSEQAWKMKREQGQQSPKQEAPLEELLTGFGTFLHLIFIFTFVCTYFLWWGFPLLFVNKVLFGFYLTCKINYLSTYSEQKFVIFWNWIDRLLKKTVATSWIWNNPHKTLACFKQFWDTRAFVEFSLLSCTKLTDKRLLKFLNHTQKRLL